MPRTGQLIHLIIIIVLSIIVLSIIVLSDAVWLLQPRGSIKAD